MSSAAISSKTDRDAVPVVAKRHGVSEQTIYTWKKRFGSFQPDDVHRLKRLEQENARLKKLVAERDLEIEVMKEIAVKKVSVPVRRGQVAYATRRGLSQRRSCTLMKVARSALGYRSAKAVRDGPVQARMVVLSAQYPRYDYRRIRTFLGRDGHPMSPGRAHRLWRRAKLQVPRSPSWDGSSISEEKKAHFSIPPWQIKGGLWAAFSFLQVIQLTG